MFSGNRSIIHFLFIFALIAMAISGEAEAGRRAKARRGRNCGHCKSGYGLVPPFNCGSGNNAAQKMYMQKRGQMISCCRPLDGQMRLVRCYNACGQRGRASLNSTHTRGQACDVAGRISFPGIRCLFHHGSNHCSTSGK